MKDIKKVEINEQINEMLQLTLAYYFKLKAKKQDKLANQVLATGSKTADLALEEIRKDYKPLACVYCGRKVIKAEEQKWLKEYGFCTFCDEMYIEANEWLKP